MKILFMLIFFVLAHFFTPVISSVSLGSSCTYSFQCMKNAFCYDNICRKAVCRVNGDCALSEVCTHGKIDDHYSDACFPLNLNQFSKLELCPGGGKPVIYFGGNYETCDLQKQCIGKGICNPFFGICCTKLRICPFPKRPLLETFTSHPVICQLRGKAVSECLRGSCEPQSGFCCISEEDHEVNPKIIIQPSTVPPNHMPLVGEKCTRTMGCAGNAACVCDQRDRNCVCECLKEMGYTLDAETKTCKRSRRRLKEKCKSDMECQAAFSECTSGGCRCKSGFQRDGNGGCMPTSHRCVNHAEPLKFDGKLMTCTTLKSEQNSLLLMDSLKNETGLKAEKRKKFRNCPSNYYCVAVFDLPKKPNLYQGFCCPLPAPDDPVCPVGNAYSGSSAPDYGCKDCPMDHFCHYDGIATKKEICCPKPCLSPDDVYVDGQCYPIGYIGDSCIKSEQCIGRSKSSTITDMNVELADMECLKGICECPKGYLAVDGSCTRIECTIGNRGEPITDSLGHIIKCQKSSDCSHGSQCDPQYKVCCKTMGVNRCPKGFIETGEKCVDNLCNETSDRCIVPKNSKQKICCREELL